MKNVCEDLRSHPAKIINCERRKYYHYCIVNTSFVIYAKKNLEITIMMTKTILKFEIIVIMLVNIEALYMTSVI